MQIKCRNVIALAATNMDELDTEWDCLLGTQESGLMPSKPFVSKHLSTTLSDVCLLPLSEIRTLWYIEKKCMSSYVMINITYIAYRRWGHTSG
jgi:hypothetical protein